MESSIDLAALREDYVSHGMRRAELAPDPIQQFHLWFAQAAAAKIRDVNAMALATVSPEGGPALRIVLLKGVDARGFVFFTNYKSAKGREIAAQPRVALNFFWVQLARQVRVEGRAERTTPAESAEYFQSRPRGSQLGAWASAQSEVIADRAALEKKLAEMTAKFAGQPVPLPPHWGGYRVVPVMIEFWQGRTNRLHDRFRYTREENGGWQIARLAP